jgi:hypothetical protein
MSVHPGTLFHFRWLKDGDDYRLSVVIFGSSRREMMLETPEDWTEFTAWIKVLAAADYPGEKK